LTKFERNSEKTAKKYVPNIHISTTLSTLKTWINRGFKAFSTNKNAINKRQKTAVVLAKK